MGADGLNLVDGRELRASHELTTEVAVVGSGPAGSAVARTLARGGVKVVVVEEGPYAPANSLAPDAMTSMRLLYRDMGASVMMGNVPMPMVQGRVVGGTSVVNGAISWRLPRNVYDEWVARDAALADAIPWVEIEQITDEIERLLNVHPTEASVAGPKNLLMARGADALGLEHRPIARNVKDCRGLGRCLQGCPGAHKMSMEQTLLPDACRHGATILHDVTVRRILVEGGRAVGVAGVAAGGGSVRVRATRAVVAAASAVGTPLLLMNSDIGHGPIGRHFRCHPGVSVGGRFSDEIRLWTGATQGHEVIGLREEGLKFEVLGFDLAIAASRIKGIGRALSDGIGDMAHVVIWGAALRAQGEGRVRSSGNRAAVTFRMTRDDVVRVRRAVRVLGELLLAAGAQFVSPGVYGWRERVTDRAVMARFESEGPLDPKAYAMAVTHLFGSARMGSDRKNSVVDLQMKHHAVDRLYVADSSIFPSNTGVNPQTAILAFATVCGRRILA